MADVVIRQRVAPAYVPELWPGVSELVARIYMARGIGRLSEIETKLSALLSPKLLGGISDAAEIIATAIRQDKFIMIAGDYDCDGATGTATAIRGLRLLGCKRLDFSIPNRFKHGYGLSPELVADMQPAPDLIVTVDSGVASNAGVAAAKARGIQVVITDHHLPGDVLPDADAIVNPNVKGDEFPSKALAGVGVMFYVLLAVFQRLRASNWFEGRQEPQMASLLDLVAVGTIADLVPLDVNNRLIVSAGLSRIRRGETTPGLKQLIENAKCDMTRLTSVDIAFNIGPRINAAGRLEDMRVGVQCLIEPDVTLAQLYGNQLEEINNARKERQQEMLNEAEGLLGLLGSSNDSSRSGDASPNLGEDSSEQRTAADRGTPNSIVLYNAGWHSGIVGLVASRVKESLYRPVIALAPASEGSFELRGSARSIPGFHLRDALALVDTRHPGLMAKFGGHAMAAGLSLHVDNVEQFRGAFEQVASEMITADMLSAELLTDGDIPAGMFTLETADMLNDCGPWGQGFPAPVFDNQFDIVECTVLKEKHLRLRLADARDGSEVAGIYFNAPQLEYPTRVRAVFELSVNSFRGNRSLQLMIRHLIPQRLT